MNVYNGCTHNLKCITISEREEPDSKGYQSWGFQGGGEWGRGKERGVDYRGMPEHLGGLTSMFYI